AGREWSPPLCVPLRPYAGSSRRRRRHRSDRTPRRAGSALRWSGFRISRGRRPSCQDLDRLTGGLSGAYEPLTLHGKASYIDFVRQSRAERCDEMNGIHDPHEAGTAGGGAVLDPRDAARLLAKTRQQAQRQFQHSPPWLLAIRAVLVLGRAAPSGSRCAASIPTTGRRPQPSSWWGPLWSSTSGRRWRWPGGPPPG